MGAFFETIPKSLIPWILEQKVIWIASAPLAADGHVNVSPKGGPYFGVIDEKTFWASLPEIPSGLEAVVWFYRREYVISFSSHKETG